ncbi:SDR family NAD(P)-dependent oxidoreductase [Ktedonosporobacter rubrisoli]|uniref:Probable oxidoreductase n=1 Tax=Ktedonosporobacter rubrisoli TaxID=2509675 RepID=A0A4P6JTP6_KTERU|nr:SDR family NAD(P)-dependent oxidoreductase [Ktedonosporobacter rubrisoli]QBD78959.1 SDR family NAD(P)-dependent oxidoreductase [Ktedonosporobacter rubrisoli]
MALIITPFGPHSTAAEVSRGIDLSGKQVIVTGATSGIGIETARALANIGADVTLAVRNTYKGARVASSIMATTANRNIHVAQLDLANRASIAAFVAAWDKPLYVLVNNAGIFAPAEPRTPEGWDQQFVTNYLGHFALTLGLHSALEASGTSRIVSVSSSGHLYSPVDFNDIHFISRPYNPYDAYRQSKTANVLFAVEASKRWKTSGITANAINPGAIKTNLTSHIDTTGINLAEFSWKTPEQGAATSVFVATSSLLAGIGGRYFEDCNEAGLHQPGTKTGVAAYAIDPGLASQLWDISLDLLNDWHP